jgi:release factor glutamine methyltransferase
VSLAVNLPGVIVYATDISPAALEVARANGRRHGVTDRIVFLEGDMLAPLAEPVDMITANLPYVSKAELSHSSPLSFEPRLALDGGTEGLDGIRSLCLQADDKLNERGWLLLEIGQGQAEAVTEFLCTTYPSAKIELESDLAGIERVVSLRLTPS